MSKDMLIRRILALVFASVLILGTSYMTVFAESQCPKGGSHEYTVTIVKRATETKDGVRQYVCSKCGKAYTEAIPATGHRWSSWYVKTRPGCTKSGVMARKCVRYSSFTHYDYKTIPATGHDFGPWIIDRASTDKVEGLEHRVCANDGSHVEYGIIPVLEAGTSIINDNKVINEDSKAVSKTKTDSDKNRNNSEASSGTSSGATGSTEGKSVPLGAADAAIAGANGVATIFFILLLLPLIRVLLWVDKKRKEAEEEQ